MLLVSRTSSYLPQYCNVTDDVNDDVADPSCHSTVLPYRTALFKKDTKEHTIFHFGFSTEHSKQQARTSAFLKVGVASGSKHGFSGL